MRALKVKQLDEKDEEIAYALIALGISRNVARSLSYLQNVNEATAIELEKVAGLHQPEVSLAMKELKQREWINERDDKRLGKGRPQKIYSLKIGFDDILAQLENQQKKAVDELHAKVERLRQIA